jgi:hypothetical protein
MSSSSIVFQLIAFTQQYTFYSTTIILIIGFIGNILNIIVFLNLKIFRKNQCAFYLIIESLTNTVELILLFLIRTLTRINNGVEVANESLLWCKLRTVISVPAALLSFSIVCFAAYDQFLSTSHRISLRQMSTYKSAQCLTLAALCLLVTHSILFAIFLDVNSSVGCTISNPIFYRYYQFLYYPCFIGIVPISISSLFSFLAFRNVRQLVRHQVPIVRRRLDRQLTAMILIRTVIFVILILPHTIHRLYWLLLDYTDMELNQQATESLILEIIFSLFNLNFAVR